MVYLTTLSIAQIIESNGSVMNTEMEIIWKLAVAA
jgi:hypothetical protein